MAAVVAQAAGQTAVAALLRIFVRVLGVLASAHGGIAERNLEQEVLVRAAIFRAPQVPKIAQQVFLRRLEPQTLLDCVQAGAELA